MKDRCPDIFEPIRSIKGELSAQNSPEMQIFLQIPVLNSHGLLTVKFSRIVDVIEEWKFTIIYGNPP